MKRIYLLLCTALLLAACGNKNSFSIHGIADDPELENCKVYLINQADNTPQDSTEIADGTFDFSGKVTEPYIGQVAILIPGQGTMKVTCIVEHGEITIDLTKELISGTPQNDRLAEFYKDSRDSEFKHKLFDLYNQYYNATTKEERDLIETQYDSIDSMRVAEMSVQAKIYYADNKDNMLGAYLATLFAQESKPTASELENMLEGSSESVINFPPLQKVLEQLKSVERTAAGQHYTDIKGIATESTNATTLSELIDGKVAVVDFWASWCRPCRQEISDNLVHLYEKYSPKGVQVVGVDVWDSPERHTAAVAELGIKYPQMVDTARDATNTYGISSIPQIMIIDADGIIVARDLRGDDIEKTLIETLSKK